MVGGRPLPAPVAVPFRFDRLESGAPEGHCSSLSRAFVPLPSALQRAAGTYNSLDLFLGFGSISLGFVDGFCSLALLGVGSRSHSR